MLAGALAHELDALAWDDSRQASLHGRDGDLPADTILANDQAEIAASLWREIDAMIQEGYSLADALGDGRGGRRVLALGLEADIEDAARVDRFSFAAELLRNPTPDRRLAAGLAGPQAPELKFRRRPSASTGRPGSSPTRRAGPAKVMPLPQR